MSQKPKILFGVILLAAAFVGVAYLGRHLATQTENKKPPTQWSATSVSVDGPIGNATLDDCIEEAVDLASKGGRRVALNYKGDDRALSVFVSPDDSVPAVRKRFDDLMP